MKIRNFTPAQSNLDKRLLKIVGNDLPYFRTEEFDVKVNRIKKNLCELLNAKNHKVALLTSSGTGSMDCVLNNFVESNDRVAIINTGRFGQLWVDMCKFYGLKTIVMGKNLELLTGGLFPTVVLMQHNETDNMNLLDIEAVGKICKENDIKLVVDASSSVAIDELDMEKCNIDVLVAGTQKGLGTIAGLSIVVYRKDLKVTPKNFYLDVTKYVERTDGFSLPFTPNVVAIYQLDKKLQLLKTEGLEKHIDKIHMKREYLRRLLPGCISSTSNCGTVVIVDRNVGEIVRKLHMKGIYVCPNKGMNGNELKIGHIGEMSYSDIRLLVREIKCCLRK